MINQLLQDGLELQLGYVNLIGEVLDFDQAPIHRVLMSHRGMEFDGVDRHRPLMRMELLEKLLYVFNSEQSMNIVENLRLVRREEGCKKALRVAPSPLELARCTRLPTATSQSHHSERNDHDERERERSNERE